MDEEIEKLIQKAKEFSENVVDGINKTFLNIYESLKPIINIFQLDNKKKKVKKINIHNKKRNKSKWR